MVIKVYISGISGNKEVKKRQQRVMMILESKNISYEVIDITEPGKESDKEFMQQNSKPRGDQKHPLPPQIFNDEEYCGDFEGFDIANENDVLLPFLHMAVPIVEEPVVSANNTDEGEEEEEEESTSSQDATPPAPTRKLAPRPIQVQAESGDDNLANGTGTQSSREHSLAPDTTGDTSRDAEEKQGEPGESTEEAAKEEDTENEETKNGSAAVEETEDESNKEKEEDADVSAEEVAQNSESAKEETNEEETSTKGDEDATDQNTEE